MVGDGKKIKQVVLDWNLQTSSESLPSHLGIIFYCERCMNKQLSSIVTECENISCVF